MISMPILCNSCYFIIIQNHACPFGVLYNVLQLLQYPVAVLYAFLERQRHTHLLYFMLLYNDINTLLFCLKDGNPPFYFFLVTDGKTTCHKIIETEVLSKCKFISYWFFAIGRNELITKCKFVSHRFLAIGRNERIAKWKFVSHRFFPIGKNKCACIYIVQCFYTLKIPACIRWDSFTMKNESVVFISENYMLKTTELLCSLYHEYIDRQ